MGIDNNLAIEFMKISAQMIQGFHGYGYSASSNGRDIGDLFKELNDRVISEYLRITNEIQ